MRRLHWSVILTHVLYGRSTGGLLGKKQSYTSISRYKAENMFTQTRLNYYYVYSADFLFYVFRLAKSFNKLARYLLLSVCFLKQPFFVDEYI